MKRKGILLASLCLSAMAMTFLVGTKTQIKPVENPTVYAADPEAKEGKPAYTPSDEYYSDEQGISMNHIGSIENVWDSYKGDDVRVAVIDSGFDYDHPDFINENSESVFSMTEARGYIHATSTGEQGHYTVDTSGETGTNSILTMEPQDSSHGYCINNTWYTGLNMFRPWQGFTKFSKHGTDVCSTLASQHHDTSHTGCAGIAPNVTIVPIKVDFWTDCIWYALSYVYNLNQNASTKIDVVNMSIEAPYYYNVDSLVSAIVNQGTIVVCAAGNSKSSSPSYPASSPGAIGVGALARDSSTSFASFSNYNASGNTENSNNNVDLVAPGYVYTASWNSSTNAHYYDETHGTSFSSPIVAGAAALWKQANPSGTVSQFKTALWDSCVDMGSSGWDTTFGHGRLNVARLMGLPEDLPYEIVINNSEIVNNELVLEVGDTFDLDWTVHGTGTFDSSVTIDTWYGSNYISVDSSGHITANVAGSECVTITSNVDSNIYAYVYITVQNISVKGVSLNKNSTTINVGSTETLNATVTPSNAYNKNVSWSSDNTTVATVSSSGVVSGKKAGTATITVTTIDGGLTATCTVTVQNVPVTSVSLNKNSTSINVGSYENLSATISPSNATIKTVTWESSDTSVATVNTSGRVTGVKDGTTTITVTSTDNPVATASCTVTITNIAVTGITLSKSSTSIIVGNQETITATISPSNATIQTVTWSSSNESVATVAGGTITTIAAGSAVITCTSVDNPSATATCNVTVTEAPSYILVTDNGMLVDNDEVVITTTQNSTPIKGVTGYNGNKDATVSESEVNWRKYVVTTKTNGFWLKDNSANKYIASPGDNEFKYNTNAGVCSVDESGHLICNNRRLAINGTSYRFYGTATEYETFFLYKINKEVSSIAVKTAPTKTTYEAGETFNPAGLVVTITYKDASTYDAPYTANASLFTFNPDLETPLQLGDESVTITIGNKTTSQAITVIEPVVLNSITVSGATSQFVEGDTFSFGGTVTAHYSDGSSADVTLSSTFDGYDMTELGNQTVTAHYSFKNVSKTCIYSINVGEGTLSSIAVSGQTTSYQKNYGFSFDGTCTATFKNGYQKIVTPTSVSSPDMTTAGQKTITVSFTYNGETKSTSYDITVNGSRVVYEKQTVPTDYSFASEIDSNWSSTKSIFGTDGTRGCQWNGAGSFTLTLTNSAKVTNVTITASTNGSSNTLRVAVGGTNYGSAQTISSGASYNNKEYPFNGTSSGNIVITVNNGNKSVYIKSISVTTEQTQDISSTSDCLGLETFIDTYMHMDYIDNLGYCKDSEHHYYSSARDAFNVLNTHQRALFVGNSAYAAEYARLSAWAGFNGESFNGNNQLSSLNIEKVSVALDTPITIVIIASVICLTALGGYIFIRRRKEN